MNTKMEENGLFVHEIKHDAFVWNYLKQLIT
jgi:hypothetical protein